MAKPTGGSKGTKGGGKVSSYQGKPKPSPPSTQQGPPKTTPPSGKPGKK